MPFDAQSTFQDQPDRGAYGLQPGLLLPAAVGQSMIFGFSHNDNGFMNIEACNIGERIQFSIWEHDYPEGSWTGYFKTIITELKERDFEVDGINCTFGEISPSGGYVVFVGPELRVSLRLE